MLSAPRSTTFVPAVTMFRSCEATRAVVVRERTRSPPGGGGSGNPRRSARDRLLGFLGQRVLDGLLQRHRATLGPGSGKGDLPEPARVESTAFPTRLLYESGLRSIADFHRYAYRVFLTGRRCGVNRCVLRDTGRDRSRRGCGLHFWRSRFGNCSMLGKRHRGQFPQRFAPHPRLRPPFVHRCCGNPGSTRNGKGQKRSVCHRCFGTRHPPSVQRPSCQSRSTRGLVGFRSPRIVPPAEGFGSIYSLTGNEDG